jgi:hypothetical protein
VNGAAGTLGKGGRVEKREKSKPDVWVIAGLKMKLFRKSAFTSVCHPERSEGPYHICAIATQTW